LANLKNQFKGVKSSLNQHVNHFKIKNTIRTRSKTQVEDDWVGLSTNPKQMVQVQIKRTLSFHYDPRPKSFQQGIGTQPTNEQELEYEQYVQEILHVHQDQKYL
jgi:hypothetical protein